MIKLVALGLAIAVALVAWMGGFSHLSQPATAEQPTAQPARGQQTIQVTEADLSRQLSDRMVGRPLGSTPLGPATLTRITAQLANGHLEANGDARVASASVPVSLTASGSAQNGRAVVAVDDLRAAGVALPASARDSVQQTLQSEVDQMVDERQLRITSISIGNGKLTLVGNPR